MAQKKQEQDFSFWTKYQRFAGNELLLYLVMIIGIIGGIVVISCLSN